MDLKKIISVMFIVNHKDESNSRNANNTRDVTIAGRPATVITSGTTGTPATGECQQQQGSKQQ
jgi:hypothetical protein